MQTYNHITASPLSDAVGAEITNVNLDRANLKEEALSEIKSAFAKHGVIIIRDQDLTPEDHIAFAEKWGKININRFFEPVESYPMIAQVRKEADQKKNIGEGWHTDHSYDEIPAMGSILYAKEIPPVGGDTYFTSTCAAYDALSDNFKSLLGQLSAWHTSRHAFGKKRGEDIEKDGDDSGDRIGNADLATQDALHPVIITHPLSGRKSIYVNPDFTTHIEGCSDEESKAMLDFLYAHISKPEFQCCLKWTKGAVAIWDNRATWHRAANDYHGYRRLMHRITIEGVALS